MSNFWSPAAAGVFSSGLSLAASICFLRFCSPCCRTGGSCHSNYSFIWDNIPSHSHKQTKQGHETHSKGFHYISYVECVQFLFLFLVLLLIFVVQNTLGFCFPSHFSAIIWLFALTETVPPSAECRTLPAQKRQAALTPIWTDTERVEGNYAINATSIRTLGWSMALNWSIRHSGFFASRAWHELASVSLALKAEILADQQGVQMIFTLCTVCKNYLGWASALVLACVSDLISCVSRDSILFLTGLFGKLDLLSVFERSGIVSWKSDKASRK